MHYFIFSNFINQLNIQTMNLKFQSSVLITTNFERLKDFYVNVLGQSVELDFGACISLKCGISIWQLSENHKITQHLGRQYHSDGNKNLELYFEADEFETTIQSIKKHKPTLLHNVTEETWGQKTMRFYDPDNNLIEVGETIPCFIKRMYSEGMNVDEIVEKTSVPKNLVEEYIEA